MKTHEIDDGEAMSFVEAGFAACRVIDMQADPQRAAFNTYRLAFNKNAADPCLKNAVGLVLAWNAFAELVGVDGV